MAMTFDEYVQIVDETCIVKPEVLRVYSALGLVGEAGECAAYAAHEAEEHSFPARDVLTAAVLLGEIAEMIKKAHLRGDNIDGETLKATVIGNAIDLVDVMGCLIDAFSESIVDFDEYTKEASERMRHGSSEGVFTPAQPEEGAVKEAGDVLWYLAAFAKARGFTLAEAAEKNMTKLRRRKSEGKIQGSGSER